MKTSHALIALTALAASLALPTANALAILEEGVESTTRLTQLPSVVQGAVLARSCAQCPVYTLRLSADSRYFVGDKQVTLPELNQFVTGRDEFNLIIATKPGTQNVTRIVVQGLLRRAS